MSEDKSSVAGKVLAILERERAAGRRYVELSPENQVFLDELASGAKRSRPAASAAPAPAAERPAAPPRREPEPVPPPRREPEPVVERPAPPAAAARPATAAPPAAVRPAAAPPARSAAPGVRVAEGLNAGDRLPDLQAYDLDSLAAWLAPCRRCGLCEQRQQVVYGVGNPQADLMFIGEGPGADEDEQGIPFVGAAGKLLTDIIGAMTFSRDEVYIANIVKCRPPGNRNPEPDEAAACLPFLARQIELVQPKVIVTLGRVPLEQLFPEVRSGITRTRGTWLAYKDIAAMPTFHPAYLLRNPKAKREVWTDMQAVMARLGREPRTGR